MFCASSLQTIRMAFHAIKAGEGDQYIAAGVECTSRGAGMTLPVMNPRLDGSNGTGYDVYIPMGLTAENVAERCKVTREAQDEWAALSQQRAVAAREKWSCRRASRRDRFDGRRGDVETVTSGGSRGVALAGPSLGGSC